MHRTTREHYSLVQFQRSFADKNPWEYYFFGRCFEGTKNIDWPDVDISFIIRDVMKEFICCIVNCDRNVMCLDHFIACYIRAFGQNSNIKF